MQGRGGRSRGGTPRGRGGRGGGGPSGLAPRPLAAAFGAGDAYFEAGRGPGRGGQVSCSCFLSLLGAKAESRLDLKFTLLQEGFEVRTEVIAFRLAMMALHVCTTAKGLEMWVFDNLDCNGPCDDAAEAVCRLAQGGVREAAAAAGRRGRGGRGPGPGRIQGIDY